MHAYHDVTLVLYRQSPVYGGGGVPLPSVHCKPKIAVNWNIIIMMGINSAYGTVSAIKPGYGAVKPLTALKNQVNGTVSQVP